VGHVIDTMRGSISGKELRGPMSTTPDDQRIAELLDKQEIEECIKRVARGLDRHDTELARSGFHPHARDDHALFIGSAMDMINWANEFHDAGLKSHQHLLTNILIDLHGDEAHAETYVTVVGVAKIGRPPSAEAATWIASSDAVINGASRTESPPSSGGVTPRSPNRTRQ
jgi:SnoaL-like domain